MIPTIVKMKTAVFALGALAALVAAQDLTNIPECGVSFPNHEMFVRIANQCHCQRFCVNDMLNAKAVELGCAANDLKCLCTKKDFAYGLRDCSAATCGEDKAGPIVAYGVQVCKSMFSDPRVHLPKLIEKKTEAGVEITNAPTGTGGSPTVSVPPTTLPTSSIHNVLKRL